MFLKDLFFLTFSLDKNNIGCPLRQYDELKPSLAIITYDDSVREEAEKVFRILIRDKKVSFCDAISFVVAKAILNDIACLSFDDDFSRLGLTIIR